MAGYYDNQEKPLPIGKMDRRITVQQMTTTRSTTGAEIVAWTDWRTLWACVEYPNSGNSEEIATDQEMITRRVRFIIRWSTGAATIQEKWRIVYEDDTHDITRIVPMGRRSYLDITTELRK